MNLGLSDELKKAFPDVKPEARPLEICNTIKDPHWVAGFVSAEGNFSINIFKSDTAIGEAVSLIFSVYQHYRDEALIKSLKTIFKGCGNSYNNRNAVEFRVRSFSDIEKIIIPFFFKYRLQGVKSKDFADFCKAVEIMKVKGHLTSEGLNEIRKLKSGMNRGRE